MSTLTPKSLLRQVKTVTELRILEELAYLQRLHQAKHGPKARFVWPSQDYLARKIGRARGTVCRAIKRLRKAGLLLCLHQRKRFGQWRTNLYKISTTAKERVTAIAAFFHTRPHRVTSAAHKQEELITNERFSPPKRLAEVLAAIQNRLRPPEGAQ